VAAEDLVPPVRIGPTEEEAPALAAANAARHDWMAAAGQQDRTPPEERRYPRSSDFIVSTTDPDATHLRQRDGVRLGYQDHYVVDGGKARIILTALVASAEVPEDQPTLDLIWHARFRWHLWPRQATGDKAYATFAVIRGLEEQGVRAYLPLPDYDGRSAYFGKSAFRYDPQTDTYTCPAGATLPYYRASRSVHLYLYQADAATCNACPLKERCTPSSQGRMISRNYDEDYLDRVRAYQGTPAYMKAYRKRSLWVEPLFAEAKDWHGLRRFRLRRLWRVNIEALMIATGQNLKRLLSWRGWGRRPWPSGAQGLRVGPAWLCSSPVLWLVWLLGARRGPSDAPSLRLVA
jgi:hypothetical protein